MSMGKNAISTESLKRREEALELSGWGLPFKFFQPHNLCFWVFVVVMAGGLVGMFEFYSGSGRQLAPAIGVGTVSVAIYGLIFVAILRLSDHYERQPRKLVLTAFLWGGIAATFAIAVTANNAMLAIYPKLFGQAFGTDWGAALSAPFTEETAKAGGFILLLGLAPRLIRSPYDGIFIGAFIGLGFQLFEDVLYSYNTALTAFGVDQAGVAFSTFLARAGTGMFSHTLYTALFCCGIIYAVGTPLQKRRLGLGISLMALAMAAHGIWDGAAALGDGSSVGLLGAALVGVASLVAVLISLHKTVPEERDFLRSILQPELELGTISAEELDAVCAPRKARRRFIRDGRGRKRHRRRKHLLRATLDLAHEIARARGGESEGVAHERAEITRLRGKSSPEPPEKMGATPVSEPTSA
ncbi:MAG TPA: PrsW family intramembrane metalloprotease [Solirubrobacterales bacterium]|nr:PrsW family intramembrane metalloprotease [Solirubrobacterales bacterium]